MAGQFAPVFQFAVAHGLVHPVLAGEAVVTFGRAAGHLGRGVLRLVDEGGSGLVVGVGVHLDRSQVGRLRLVDHPEQEVGAHFLALHAVGRRHRRGGDDAVFPAVVHMAHHAVARHLGRGGGGGHHHRGSHQAAQQLSGPRGVHAAPRPESGRQRPG